MEGGDSRRRPGGPLAHALPALRFRGLRQRIGSAGRPGIRAARPRSNDRSRGDAGPQGPAGDPPSRAAARQLVVLAAAWLVWTRPGRMSWGFFLYVMWFNPGQSFAFYAVLQQWPLLLLMQNAAASFAQAAGFAGLLAFVLRVPSGKSEPAWRPLERALPLIALVLAVGLFVSYGSLFGFATETASRTALMAGFGVGLGALVILMVRCRHQTPEDFQRVR